MILYLSSVYFLILCIITYAAENVTNTVQDTSILSKATTNSEDKNFTSASTVSVIIEKLPDESINPINLTWNAFLRELVNVTVKQLDIIKLNAMYDYNLDKNQIENIEPLFNFSKEYQLIIHKNIKSLIYNNKLNKTVKCMLDYTKKSNFVLEKIIAFNLDKITFKPNTSTIWYNQTKKEKIQRQETKAATNRVDCYICQSLGVCKDKRSYSDYLKDWLRRLLGTPEVLGEVFETAIDLLQKHKNFIKSNVKFLQTVKYIYASGFTVQKDTIDFLDEVLTNRKNVLNLTTDGLRKDASNLIDLFTILEKNYIMDDNNKRSLDSITTSLDKWIEDSSIAISFILNSVVENMKLNLGFWSLKALNRLNEIWTTIIAL